MFEVRCEINPRLEGSFAQSSSSVHLSVRWLNRPYAKRDDGLIYTSVDPLLKSLHSDPRFAALLKRLNLPT